MSLVEQLYAAHVERRTRWHYAAKKVQDKPPVPRIVRDEPEPRTPKRKPYPRMALPPGVDTLEPLKPRLPRVPDIIWAVGIACSVSIDDIVSAQRHKAVVLPRHLAMWICKRMRSVSFLEIGRRFGGRDHTTVLHGVRRIDALVQCDAATRAKLTEILDLLRGRGFAVPETIGDQELSPPVPVPSVIGNLEMPTIPVFPLAP